MHWPRKRAVLSVLILAGSPLLLSAQQPGMTLVPQTGHAVSPPLRDVTPQLSSEGVRVIPGPRPIIGPSPTTSAAVNDTALQLTTSAAISANTTIGLNFDGMSNSGMPPDANLSVGATQIVQIVNSSFTVFSKSTGSSMYGPARLNTVFTALGGTCGGGGGYDPIVLYDKMAGRWLISDANNPFLCVAVSQTSDATGAYNLYAFNLGSSSPDYQKIGVWPDAYYASLNGSTAACAFPRSAMLAGDAVLQGVCFANSGIGILLPSDLDGSTPPPSGEPNFFVTFRGGTGLDLYRFHVDFAAPNNSTFVGPFGVQGAAPWFGCGEVPQPGTTQMLESFCGLPMYRLAYRNFGGYESLVVNQSVQVTTPGTQIGVRWYEIRDPNGTPTVYQQGTYAPDTNTYRWMGSAAQDQAGDIAIGYSVSDASSVHPGIRYAGRLATDPPNTLEAEATIVNGTGSQTNLPSDEGRWGDYSSMSIDPADDCTFWYTSEYYAQNGFRPSTRIASFKFAGCGATSRPVTPGGLTATPGTSQVSLSWNTSSGANSYNVYRSTSGNPYTFITSVVTPSYLDTGLTNGTEYYYVVTAMNSFGESGYSNQASAIPTPPLPPPTVVLANPNSGVLNQNLPNVILTGINFQNGARCYFGTDIAVNSCTFNSSTQLAANITIGAMATGGMHNVRVTNPDGQGSTLPGGFYVTAITVVQSWGYIANPSSSGTVNFDLALPTVAGHNLIVGLTFSPSDITSVTDTSGDTFTRGLTTSAFHNVAGSATYTNFYYAKKTAGGATSVTLTFSGGSTTALVFFAEVAGLDTTAPLDQSAYYEPLTPTTTWSSAAITTNTNSEYLFSWAATRSGTVGAPQVPPTCSNPAAGWIWEFQSPPYGGVPARICGLDRVVSATASYQASITATPAEDYAMEIVAFKGATPPPPSDFTISLATPSQASLAGGTATYGVTLTASGKFNQPVTLTCSSLPAAVFCSTALPVTPTASGATAAITVNVPGALASSTSPYSFAITGTSGILSHSAPVQLFAATLSATITPSAATVNVGSSANFSFSLTATDNFAGAISLNCAGLAPGLRCVYPAPVTVPGSATLAVFVDAKPSSSSIHTGPPDPPVRGMALATLVFLTMIAMAVYRRKDLDAATLSRGLAALALVLVLAIGLISCGGTTSGSSGSNGFSSGGTGGSAGSGSGGTGGGGGTGGTGGSGGGGGTGGDSSVTTQFMLQGQSGGATVNLATVSITVP